MVSTTVLESKYQVMPDLTPIEYEALKADIAENGVLVPVEVDENGEILDGHHRVKAWEELTADRLTLPDYPKMIRCGWSEEQKRNHARRLNVLRRQLSKDQRDQVMIDFRKDGLSYRQIAEAVGVDAATVHRTIQKSPVAIATPSITGKDGKTYPAQQHKPNADLPDTRRFDWEFEQVSYETEDEPEAEPVKVAPPADVVSPDKMKVHFSSETPEHYTPRVIIEATLDLWDVIELDPCSNSKTAPNVPASEHFTIEDDGLFQSWMGKVYMNPPYGREINAWVEKLCAEHEAGNTTEAIALVPARTDTQWFKKLRDYPVCFVEGRLTFVGNDDPAPFPSAVFYLGANIGRFYRAFSELGDIWQRIEPDMFGE